MKKQRQEKGRHQKWMKGFLWMNQIPMKKEVPHYFQKKNLEKDLLWERNC